MSAARKAITFSLEGARERDSKNTRNTRTATSSQGERERERGSRSRSSCFRLERTVRGAKTWSQTQIKRLLGSRGYPSSWQRIRRGGEEDLARAQRKEMAAGEKGWRAQSISGGMRQDCLAAWTRETPPDFSPFSPSASFECFFRVTKIVVVVVERATSSSTRFLPPLSKTLRYKYHVASVYFSQKILSNPVL